MSRNMKVGRGHRARHATVVMDPTTKLTKALFKSTRDPKVAWYLFKRILSLPISDSNSDPLLQSIPIITRILKRSQMLPQLDLLPQLLLDSHPPPLCLPSLSSLVVTLAKFGLFDRAFSLFKSLRSRFPQHPHSAYLYNVLLKSSIQNSPHHVPWLCDDMVLSRVPPDTYIFNTLIGWLCDDGRLVEAQEMFDKMSLKGCKPNEFTFCILVNGYCRAGLSGKALELLGELKRLGCRPNKVMYNTLISSFCKEGKIDDAEELIDRMRKDGLSPDIVSCNSRISALCRVGKIVEASRIFRDMQIDEYLGLPRPNVITYNLMHEGFRKEGMLDEANSLVETMKTKGMVIQGTDPDIHSNNIVMDGLCKNGMLSDVMTSGGVSPVTPVEGEGNVGS